MSPPGQNPGSLQSCHPAACNENLLLRLRLPDDPAPLFPGEWVDHAGDPFVQLVTAWGVIASLHTARAVEDLLLPAFPYLIGKFAVTDRLAAQGNEIRFAGSHRLPGQGRVVDPPYSNRRGSLHTS